MYIKINLFDGNKKTYSFEQVQSNICSLSCVISIGLLPVIFSCGGSSTATVISAPRLLGIISDPPLEFSNLHIFCSRICLKLKRTSVMWNIHSTTCCKLNNYKRGLFTVYNWYLQQRCYCSWIIHSTFKVTLTLMCFYASLGMPVCFILVLGRNYNQNSSTSLDVYINCCFSVCTCHYS